MGHPTEPKRLETFSIKLKRLTKKSSKIIYLISFNQTKKERNIGS